MVPDRGDRCLFIFLWARCLFFNVFPFPVCKAQLIGDWYENRRGAPNTVIFLIIRQYQYYWRSDAPCAKSNGGPNRKKKLLAHNVWSALLIGGGGHQCVKIYWHTDAPRAITIGGPMVSHTSRQSSKLFSSRWKWD
jgi:hypothetical protein